VTLDRRTLVLGVAAAAAVGAAVTVAVSKRGSGESEQRRAVGAYIQQVNGIQNHMHAPITRVLLAFRDFTAKSGPKKGSATELHEAARTLAKLDRRLAALTAPPEARQLRRLLLTLISRQAAIAHEVELMSTFTPRFSRVLRSARAANTALGTALAAVPVPKAHKLRGTRKKVLAAQRAYRTQAQLARNAQAAAVDAYDRRVGDVLRRLLALRPPPAFAVGLRAQIQALTDVVAAGEQLAAALRASNGGNVATLGRQFTLASRESQSVSAQQAQVAAIRAYNARARGVAQATARVQAELLRLQKSLP
jgi:hypothetical protein